jgi:cell division protein FtsB
MIRDYLLFMEALRPLLPFLVLGTTAYFARRAIRAFERRAAAQAELGELRARVAQLEEQAEDTTRDVMRLQAANDFAAQLLRGRLSEPSVGFADPPSSER